MPSPSVRALNLLLRATRKPRMATERAARARLAGSEGIAIPPALLLPGHVVRRREVAGRPVYTVLPKRGGAPERAVLYLHGGAYVAPITPWHWWLVGRMADQGTRVEVALYGLAPEHTHREALPFLERVYRELIDAVPARRVALAGDSAGGGLALALAQRVIGAGLPAPGRSILVSPWVDATMTNPEIAGIEPRDPWLASIGLRISAEAWAGGDDPSVPGLSPLHGSMEGLPPTDVYVGTHDLFLPDVRLACERMRRAGVRVDLEEAEGLFHVYPLVPCPEGRRARDRILRRLRGL
ncbi:alpha/beta hydrolase fold domain-containing protein [Nocardiopsis alba]|uniref:alpha/beta hydrolase fold domain-containing protein n=1 Tax=Nocardiopsis alba TaxID=53437 RepID=UPI0035E25AE3